MNAVYSLYLVDIQRYYRDFGPDRVTRFRQAVPPPTDSRDSGENRGRQVALTQRLGGRWLVIPKSSREANGGWDLIEFLVGDDANNAMFDQCGRFASTRSFVAAGRWKSQPPLQFFADSLASANHLTSRAMNAVASFAEAKWEQALADIFGGNLPVIDALTAAQKAVEVEYRQVGALS